MSTCTVTGTITDTSATAVDGAIVRFNIVTPTIDSAGNLVAPTEINTTTGSSGTWSLNIDQGLSGIISVDYPPNSTDSTRRYTFSVVIPSTTSATFASLINSET